MPSISHEVATETHLSVPQWPGSVTLRRRRGRSVRLFHDRMNFALSSEPHRRSEGLPTVVIRTAPGCSGRVLMNTVVVGEIEDGNLSTSVARCVTLLTSRRQHERWVIPWHVHVKTRSITLTEGALPATRQSCMGIPLQSTAVRMEGARSASPHRHGGDRVSWFDVTLA
jgi:hypothetical protein